MAPRLDATVLLQNLAGGGAERVMLRLAKGLSAAGHDVELALLRWQGEYLDEVADWPFAIDLAAGKTALSLPKLIAYLRARRPRWLISALAHVNCAAVVAARLARSGTRVMLTEHNLIDDQSIRERTFGGRFAYRLLPAIYPFADSIVAVSDGVAADLVRHRLLKPKRIHVIHNPVVTLALHGRARADVAHPWFAPGAPPVVLGVGRLHPQKNFPLLLQAYADLSRRRDCRLVILGDGEQRERLLALAGSLEITDDVDVMGFVGNPFPYMARAAVVALSSDWEGLPTVLIEALACGTTVVATDCPHGPRDILDHGRFGYLVPRGDRAAFAAALERAIDTPLPAADLVKRADLFSDDRAVTAYADLMAA